MSNLRDRQSYIELLRIISMLLVMILYIGYALTNHVHSYVDNVIHVFIEGATIICVLIFSY